MKSLFLSLIICFSVQAMEKIASKQPSQITREILCRTLDHEDCYTLPAEMADSFEWIRKEINENPTLGTLENPLILPISQWQGAWTTTIFNLAKHWKEAGSAPFGYFENWKANQLADILKSLHVLGNSSLFKLVAEGLRSHYKRIHGDNAQNLESFITTLGLSDEIQLLLRNIYWPKG